MEPVEARGGHLGLSPAGELWKYVEGLHGALKLATLIRSPLVKDCPWRDTLLVPCPFSSSHLSTGQVQPSEGSPRHRNIRVGC